jgi:citrate lyase subunit beta/citryl-CoA lyase
MFPTALKSEADALILDLEDSVPPDAKASARESVVHFLRKNRGGVDRPSLLVRVNAIDEPNFFDDVVAVVAAGAAGIVVPKVETVDDIVATDRLLGWLETQAGRPVGGTLICPILETARAIWSAYELGRASRRIAYMGGWTARGADVERAIGYRTSRGAEETVPLRAYVLMAARAAGVPNPIVGLWTDIKDLEGLRAFALQGRGLGYDGMVVIHPSHVAIANEIFGTTEAELQRYERLLEAMQEAETRGSAAVMFDGHMVDIATLETARERLGRVPRSESSTPA